MITLFIKAFKFIIDRFTYTYIYQQTIISRYDSPLLFIGSDSSEVEYLCCQASDGRSYTCVAISDEEMYDFINNLKCARTIMEGKESHIQSILFEDYMIKGMKKHGEIKEENLPEKGVFYNV